ncbi:MULTISPECIES: carbonic anhydrase [unclassified Streptomyces]|uniref:carbonic anhydrase n=1 Tax=unclassified Streptomyces TaxID=2593676 RepID=UPI00248204DB|nr:MULTISPECIES: carbonic anhydrase [unclassified Streptomyces]MDA5279566.1 carbonic anhydrase [Streptomyces sp. Isolate_45]MDX2390988.1 carbonic anhydrase [Streptomyces sp. DK15]
MDDLLKRARSFRHRIAREKEIFRSFALGQSPATLFITCSDSRVVPTLITAAAPGELFELRNAGNIVPPYRPGYRTGEAATIEYAVEVLKVRDIIVCGHSHCGAVGAVARGEDLTHLPSVADWVDFARPALTGLLDIPPKDPALPDAVQRHVTAQLMTLRGYPQIERGTAEGQLSLHGWFYRVDTGDLWELDETRGVFGQH